MATAKQHLQEFEHNTVVAQRHSESGDYDWAVIALFYASLHLVQAYLVRKGINVRSHSQRNREMVRNSELRPVYNSYRALRDMSEDARYECRRFSRKEFDAIRTGPYADVVSHVQGLRSR